MLQMAPMNWMFKKNMFMIFNFLNYYSYMIKNDNNKNNYKNKLIKKF